MDHDASPRPSRVARTRTLAAAGGRSRRGRARAPVTGCQTPIDGTDDDRAAGDAGRLRHLGPDHQGTAAAARPAARSRPGSAAAEGDRPAARGDPHRLDRPPGRRDRLPRRALRRRLARRRRPAFMDELRRRPCSASTPRRLRFDDPDTETVPDVTHHQGRPRRSATCRSSTPRWSSPAAAASASTDDAAGHRRPRPGLPGAHRRDHPDAHRRAGRGHRRRGRRRHAPTARRGWWCCPPAPACWPGRSWSSAPTPEQPPRRAATTSTPTPATSSTSGRLRRRRRAAPHAAGGRGRRAAPGRATPDPRQRRRSPARTRCGRDLTAFGLQNGDGVELTDTTTEAWDAAHRHRRGPDLRRLDGQATTPSCPGKLVTSPSTTITDADAIAAQAYSHEIVDYYEALGRDSWDDKGGPLISSVHFGPGDLLQRVLRQLPAPAADGLRQPVRPAGPAADRTFVEPDIAAHEVTHGVTATTAGLLYTGQSGALNESFSDYFGNVIGNLIHGTDSVAIGEDACAGATAEPAVRAANPDGTTSFRYMLNGTDFDDYLRVLDPGRAAAAAGQLHAGLRRRALQLRDLEQRALDASAPGWPRSTASPATPRRWRTPSTARSTARWPPGSRRPAASSTPRAAVEQVIIDSQLDPVVLRTAREVFDADKICTGCPTPSELAGRRRHHVAADPAAPRRSPATRCSGST